MADTPTVTDAARFERCLEQVLRHEGGYADHPADPGGATNMGITIKTLARWRGIEPWSKLEKAEVKRLQKSEAAQIYRAIYWNRCKGAELMAGVDLAVFDYAVNSGPDRVIKALQRQVSVVADGYVGPLTLAALRSREAAAIIDALCDQRLGFLGRLTTFAIFGRGWSSRVADIRKAALAMTGSAPSHQTSKETDAMTLLAGYRSYIVAAFMLAAGLCQLVGIDLPTLDGQSAGQLIMEAFAVVFLRKGIANTIGKV